MIKKGNRVVATRDTDYYREGDRGTVTTAVEVREVLVDCRVQFDRQAPCGKSQPMWAIYLTDIKKDSPSYLWRFLFEGIW